MRMSAVTPEEAADIVAMSWRMVAPKKLRNAL
jgi:hypothetical protein